jgi:hypothetical protein
MRTSLTFALALATACGGNSPSGPNPSGGDSFTASIDGNAWVSSQSQTTGGGSGSNAVPGSITLIGTQFQGGPGSYTTLTLSLGYISGPGTYPLGVNHGTTAGGTGAVTSLVGATFSMWSTNFPGNAGTVNISSVSNGRIVGTFQFTAPPQSFTTTTGTRVVNSGSFNLPLPATFAPAPANNAGSKVTATVGTTNWNGATIVALGTQNVFGFTATTDTFSITITPASTLQAGNSYPIGGTGGATMMVTRVGTALSWNSVSNTPVGTLTISTLGGFRATGTFFATLLPGSGTTGSLAIANGTFDVRIDSP